MDATTVKDLLDAWQQRLARISEAEADRVIGSQWTRKQVLGHLIDSAANNHQRFIRLQQGNLAGFPGYDQEHWVAAGNYQKNSWSNLLELWTQYNRQLILVIENIDPACGSNMWEEKSFDLNFIVTDYSRHLLHHLEQLGKK